MVDDVITTWKGRDIRELQRNELLEALAWATKAYNDALNRSIENNKLWHDMYKLKPW